MQTLTYDGTFNIPLLAQEIRTKLPDIAFDRNNDGLVDLSFDVQATTTGIVVYLTDDVEESVFKSYIIDQHDPNGQTDDQVFKAKILAIAQTCVGVKLTDLTALQIKSLLACLLYESGGVNPSDLTVNPLANWVSAPSATPLQTNLK